MTTLAASHAAADWTVTETVFRRVMASFVTGVTVITTQVHGEIRGMTANAFMSGSLEPPLCVVSVGKKARMHAFLLESGHFGVNILARGQEHQVRRRSPRSRAVASFLWFMMMPSRLNRMRSRR